MAWNIVRHSFMLLMRNLADALKVSVGPVVAGFAVVYLASIALGVPFEMVFASTSPEAMTDAMVAAGGSLLLLVLLALLVLLFVSGWVAVSWHRFVLLEEYPSVIPGISGRPIWPYVWLVFVLGIVLFLISLPLGFVLGLVALPFVGPDPGQPGAALAFGLVILFSSVLTWFWFRFGLILPARSVGRSMTMGESWRSTAPAAGSIFGAVLILLIFSLGSGVLVSLVFGDGLVGTALDTAVNWVGLMVGMSMLTTLYGHLVEGRPLG